MKPVVEGRADTVDTGIFTEVCTNLVDKLKQI
jgi:hypothetical protein